MSGAVLALNAGSSSLKFGLYERPAINDQPGILASGSVRFVNSDSLLVEATAADGSALVDEQLTGMSQEVGVEWLLGWIDGQFGQASLTAVGHRIVHGGAEFGDPVEIDDHVFSRLEALTPFAPLHQPISLAPVRLIRSLRPELPQIACFDTAFHRQIRPPASRYALPRRFEGEGIRRFGFHGLSYESIAAQLSAANDQGRNARDMRIIVAHLGNGASLCAMRDLKSVDTTMGFSTLDGLVMGTRCGSVDPGILLYLLKEKGFSADRLEKLLYHESGLLGVSGVSSDVATLLDSDSPAAAEALDLFAFHVARQTAALTATLGGLDRFIFTGGIGEHAVEVRRMIANRLEWLGAELDDEGNSSGATKISTGESSILLECRSTQEELMIARHVLARI